MEDSMRKISIAAGISILLAGFVAAATGQSIQQTGEIKSAQSVLPKLGEKHKVLAVLAGDWVITGKTYPTSPWGAGTFTAREHNEFMKGGLFLVSKTQYSEQFNNSSQIGLFGVDPASGQYTFSLFNSTGVTVRVLGNLRDKSTSKLIGNAIYWGAPPAGPGVAPTAGSETDKETNVAELAAGGAMTYTTEFISADEYRFSMDRGGVRSYEGVARRVTSVSSSN